MSIHSAPHEIDLDTARLAEWPGLPRPHGNGDASRRLRLLIEDIVAGVFGVDPEDLRKPTRGQARIALARQVAMYIAHVGFSLTLTEVGEMFARDRTTVAHACTVVEQRRDDGAFDASVVLLEQIIRAVNVAGFAAERPSLDGMR